MDASLPVVIVNPRSAGGSAGRRWERLVGLIADALGPFDTRFTAAPGDGRKLACEAAEAGRRLVIALGGDGTISEVADGLLAVGGRAEMGIIPLGTGGDFRRVLDLPVDPGLAARRIGGASARKIDAGRVTFTARDGSETVRHFVNVASFGFSSDVAMRANRASKRLGPKAAFLGATARSLLSYENVEVVVTADRSEERTMTLLLAALGNGRYFGGGMKICPEALLDDGLLDVVAIGDLGRVAVLVKMQRLYAGTHVHMPEVRTARVGLLEVRPARPDARIPIEIDGETPGLLPARFEVLPRALSLRF